MVRNFCKSIHIPFHVDYERVMTDFFEPNAPEALSPKFYPALIPNWDHSPRSAWRGTVYTNSTPENFRKHAEKVIRAFRGKDQIAITPRPSFSVLSLEKSYLVGGLIGIGSRWAKRGCTGIANARAAAANGHRRSDRRRRRP